MILSSGPGRGTLSKCQRYVFQLRVLSVQEEGSNRICSAHARRRFRTTLSVGGWSKTRGYLAGTVKFLLCGKLQCGVSLGFSQFQLSWPLPLAGRGCSRLLVVTIFGCIG